MTQKTINLATAIFILFLVFMVLMLAFRIWQEKNYSWETRNRLTQLEERLNFQIERVSTIDNNLYHKIMTDETAELVKESLNLVEDTVWCDCMFYSFENKWVVFSTTSMTWEQKYFYVDVDRKFVQWNYIPKFLYK